MKTLRKKLCIRVRIRPNTERYTPRTDRNVRAYSMTRDSKYTWNILLESGMFFRIQIEYSRMTWGFREIIRPTF